MHQAAKLIGLRCSIAAQYGSQHLAAQLSSCLTSLQPNIFTSPSSNLHQNQPVVSLSHSTNQLPFDQSRSSAVIICGRSLANEWLLQLEHQTAELTSKLGRPPGLQVIMAGNRPDSLLYVRNKQIACEAVGIHMTLTQLPSSCTQQQIQSAVDQACKQADVDGVLVQLPLPRHIDEELVMVGIDAKKDVDGFHPLNQGRLLMRGVPPRFIPCTPLACINILDACKVPIAGASVVVVGDSTIVGSPLAALLRDRGAAFVTVCHKPSYAHYFDSVCESEGSAGSVSARRASVKACLPKLPGPRASGARSGTHAHEGTQQQSRGVSADSLPRVCRGGDIVIVAAGIAGLVKGHWVKPGAVVVDVGINVVYCNNHEPSILDVVSGAQYQQQHNGQRNEQRNEQYTDKQHKEQYNIEQQREQHQCELHNNEQHNNEQHNNEQVGFKIVGDVDLREVCSTASMVTPGGVGPMTIASVVHNTLLAAKYNANLEQW